MVSLDLEIRNCLISYLVGEISLDSFQDWFVAATWDVEEAGEPRAEELTYAIQHAFAEYTNGHLTDADLRERLIPLTNPFWVDNWVSNQQTASTSVIVTFPVTFQPSGSRMQFSVAFV